MEGQGNLVCTLKRAMIGVVMRMANGYKYAYALWLPCCHWNWLVQEDRDESRFCKLATDYELPWPTTNNCSHQEPAYVGYRVQVC